MDQKFYPCVLDDPLVGVVVSHVEPGDGSRQGLPTRVAECLAQPFVLHLSDEPTGGKCHLLLLILHLFVVFFSNKATTPPLVIVTLQKYGCSSVYYTIFR